MTDAQPTDTPPTDARRDALEAWIDAGEKGDAEAAGAALADNVVLISPITDRFTFTGRDEVVDLLRDVFDVISGIHYVRVDRTPSSAVLFVKARIGDLAINEAQFVDFDPEGNISTLTLFFRPLTASTRFLRELGPRVARRQGNAGTARTLAAAGLFLDSVAASGDRTFVPMAAPPSSRA